MKISIFLALITAQSVFAQTNYTCTSNDGIQAQLTINSNNQSIYWQDLTHSADTEGIFQGLEDASYSTSYGYLVYQASNYEISEDSAWYFKLEPTYTKQKPFKVIEVFDNDGHEESETVFQCQ